MKRTYPDYPGHRGEDTSIASAAALAADLNRLQGLVHGAVVATTESADGCTVAEAADLLRLDYHSVGKRMSELKDKGLVKDSGRRRLNPSGRTAKVWITMQPPIAICPTTGTAPNGPRRDAFPAAL